MEHIGRRAQARVTRRAIRGWWPQQASAPGVLRRSGYRPLPAPRARGANVRGAIAILINNIRAALKGVI
jgi:hypothetical protein